MRKRSFMRMPAKAIVGSATLAALGLVAVLIWSSTDGDRTTIVPSPTHARETVIGSSDQALDSVLKDLGQKGSLQPSETPDATVHELLYGEAAERASLLGVELPIRPENYECPGGCPYPGELADSRGWLVVVRQVRGRLPDATASGYLYWLGEDGGTTIAVLR
jgi:hypothetical protein